mgnify:CR=1 FL=1
MAHENINFDLYARNAELAVRNKTLSLLHKLDEVTLSTLSTREMTERIATTLAKEFDYPFVALGMCDAAQKYFQWLAASCPRDESKLCAQASSWPKLSLTKVRNAATKSIRTHRRLELRTLSELLTPAAPDDLIQLLSADEQLKSILVFPLVAKSECLGLLAIGLNRGVESLTKYEQETFSPMLGLVTVALQKAEIYSSLVEATANLKVVNKRLKELDAVKTEFVSIASHQLRTPLAAIRGYVDLIKDGTYGQITPPQTEVVGKVHDSVEALIELVGQLLNVSRIESGKTNVEITTIDLASVCTEVSNFLGVKASERGLSLSCDDTRLPPVFGDASKVREVMMNLVENALKYTDKGGVKIIYTEEPKFVRIDVVDTGFGLTKASIEKLFQKFSRAEATAADYPGTGLGLYVCKRLVEAMGGEIWAESPGLGKGSSFCFRLPKAAKASKKSKAK